MKMVFIGIDHSSEKDYMVYTVMYRYTENGKEFFRILEAFDNEEAVIEYCKKNNFTIHKADNEKSRWKIR